MTDQPDEQRVETVARIRPRALGTATKTSSTMARITPGRGCGCAPPASNSSPSNERNLVNFALVADMSLWPRARCACGHYDGAVDLGVDKVESIGRLYLCTRCVNEVLRPADSERCPTSERDVALEVAKQATLRAEMAGGGRATAPGAICW
jgi:hypothetical protein